MITISTNTSNQYSQLVERYQKAQAQKTLKQDLKEIFQEFLDKNSSLSAGLSLEDIASVEANLENRIDIIFKNKFNPWLCMRFTEDFNRINMMAGPAVYDYMLEDESCIRAWEHRFTSSPELDSILSQLIETTPHIQRKTTAITPASFQKLTSSGATQGILFIPVYFPMSSATRTTPAYLFGRDFEIRETVFPASALSYIISYIKDNPKNPPCNDPAVTINYPVFEDPSKIPEDLWPCKKGPGHIIIDLKEQQYGKYKPGK